ncbi:MAG TPA: hypothetical protein VFI16_05575, partial [Anaeromyxobacteraceae bacterium]|nr:hypothetical protein [Anaeromyxobacteraceae bacterium]
MAVRKRLGEMLLEAKVIDQNQLDAALSHQRQWGGRLGQALVDLKLTSEARIVEALSRKFGYEVVQVEALEGGPLVEAALTLLPREVASRHNVLPYAADTSTVSVAMSDPGNIAVVDEIRFRAGRRVKVALAGDREVAAAVRRFYYPGEKEPPDLSLELDEDGSSGETVVDQFGGGSVDALDRFFATPAAPGAAPPAAAPEPRAASSEPGGAEAPVPDAVELEDFLTPAPAPLRAVEAVARAHPQAPATPALRALAPPAPAAAGPPAGARAPAPAAAGPKAGAKAPAAAAGRPGEEAAEKSGTLELPLDAEIPPEAAGEDLWSQGPQARASAAPEAVGAS